MINKKVNASTFKDVLKDGMSIMVGGFMANGTPEGLVDIIIESGVKDLVMYCNDAGFPDKGIGRIIANGQCKTLVASHIGLNPEAQAMMNDGRMEIELVPQGTLAEQIRAGGSGLGGVLTPTGLGTEVAKGKEVITVDGKEFLLEKPFTADLAIIKSNTSDLAGNSVLLGTTKNFNLPMSLAAKTVAIEADEIVDNIPHEEVNIPHVVVNLLLEKGGK